MAITVQCPRCHARFIATEEVVGRKVRCRKCGAIIPVRAAGDDDLFTMDQLNFDGGAAAMAADGGAGPPRLDLIDPDQLFEQASQEFEPPRSNAIFVFPFSREIDRYLPFALALFGLIWLGNQVISTASGMPGWVAFVRMLALVLAFGMLVLPATYIAVRITAQKLRFHLPTFTMWRVGTVFWVPFVLATSMWLLDGEGTDLLTGCVIGLLLALPALWLLLRLEPEEGPITLAVAGASFGGAMLLVVGAGLLFGTMVNASADPANNPTAFSENPLGPGLRWDLPPPKPRIVASDTPPETAPTTDESPGTDESDELTNPPATAPTTSPTTAPVTDPLPDQPESVPTTLPVEDSPIPPPATQPLPEPPAEATVHEEEPEDPFDAITPMVREAKNPLRAEFDAVIAPTVPSDWMALLSNGSDGEQVIERWNTKTWLPQGKALFAGGAGTASGYHLSSDGKYIARLSKFPVLSVQVYAYDPGKLLPPVRLSDTMGTPSLLGFTEPDLVAVHWRKDETVTIEVVNVLTGRWIRRIQKVGLFDPAPNEYVISGDGRLLAAVSRTEKSGTLELHSLSRDRESRQIRIQEVAWEGSVQVSGVALSQERSRASVMLEREGQALLLCWDTATGQLISQHMYQAGLRNSQTRNFLGPPLHFLDEGRAWLIFGSAIYSTTTGKVVGNLGTKSPLRQWVSDDVVYLTHHSSQGSGHSLAVLKLHMPRLRAALAKKS